VPENGNRLYFHSENHLPIIENDENIIKPERAVQILKEDGLIVTIEQAKTILEFLFDGGDYRIIKSDCKNKINILEQKLSFLGNTQENIDAILDKAVNTLSHLDTLYENAASLKKREIISSIYPEKLVFDGFNYRTPRLNEAVRLIYNMDAAFEENKNGTNDNFSHLSHQ
jgi:hypothetical protein